MMRRSFSSFSSAISLKSNVAVNEKITYQYVDKVPSSVKKQISYFRRNILSIPLVIKGKAYHYSFENNYGKQIIPYDKENICASYPLAGCYELNMALEGVEYGKKIWNSLSLQKRIDIFWKAGDLVANEYRFRLLAGTMLGQGKTIYQAEIDGICELADFFRFNAMYREQLESEQPISKDGERNVSSWVGLDGFVGAITPFNFTAIGGNLATMPLLMGNSVIWKPSDNAVLSNYLVYELMLEAGMPPEVIQFVPSNPELFMGKMVKSRRMGGLLYTGSSSVFNGILERVYSGVSDYDFYPRVVGETGGMNYHFVFPDYDDMDWLVESTIRGAFEYSGQKCSATRRLYLPEDKYDEFKRKFEERMNGLVVGSPEDDDVFTSAVIHKRSYDGLNDHIEKNYDKIVYGGECIDRKGYYVNPTVIMEDNLGSVLWEREVFGPVLVIHIYKTSELDKVMKHCVGCNKYRLTGSVFTNGGYEEDVGRLFLGSVGNMYMNDKCTGSVVGNQPFGGFGISGTNDKAGSKNFLTRMGNNIVVKNRI